MSERGVKRIIKKKKNVYTVKIQIKCNFVFRVTLQEHFLPYILTSKVKLILQGDEDKQSLLNFVDSSMKIPEQKLVLEVFLD